MSYIEEPIWIVHLCNRLSVGGVQAFLLNYYKKIDKQKVQFAFVVQRQDDFPYDNEICKMGGRVHKVTRMNESIIEYYRDLKKIIEKYPEYKIVHSHMNHRNGIALLICKILQVPIRISHAHNLGPHFKLLVYFRVQILKIINKFVATDYFACSTEAGKYLYGNNLNYKVINNAIDASLFIYSEERRSKMRRSLKLSNEYAIGHIGNFSEQKNYFFLIDVFSLLKGNYKLLLIGTGKLESEVRNYVNEKKLSDKVDFLGVRDDIPMLMQALDLFILPSKYEGFGIVAIESQASGLPTICSNGVPTEVDITDLAYHIPLSLNSIVWANKIEEIIMTRTIRSNRKIDIENSGFDLETNAEVLQDFYQSVFRRVKEEGL